MQRAMSHKRVLMSTFLSYVPARLDNPHGAEIPRARQHPWILLDQTTPPTTHHEVITQTLVRNKIFSLSYHYVRHVVRTDSA
jgi:hypothetical protein